MKVRRTATLVASLVAASTFVVSAPTADAALDLPVLWEGVVRTPAGAPAQAEVTAFVRPPAGSLVPNVALVPVATTSTDGDGRYRLRSLPSAAFRAAQDESGWVTLLVAAFGANDVRIAVDSVAWKRAQNRWISHPSELDGATAAPGVSLSEERPGVVTLSNGRNGGTPPKGVGSCWMTGSRSMGKKDVHVGELHLNRDWGGLFEYTNTRTTSWQVGVSHKGGPWEVGGSVSWAKSHNEGQRKHPIPAAKTERIKNYDAELRFTEFEWGCNKGYPDVHRASTLEAVDWTTGMHERPNGPIPACPNRDNRVSVMPKSDYFRGDTSSLTLAGAINIAGFTGSTTTATSESAFHQWTNPLPRHREMCGESASPEQETRMVSIP